MRQTLEGKKTRKALLEKTRESLVGIIKGALSLVSLLVGHIVCFSVISRFVRHVGRSGGINTLLALARGLAVARVAGVAIHLRQVESTYKKQE